MNSRTSPIRETATFCRVCEPACGLIATVENGELTGLRPDKANVVTRGFACNKGLAGDEIHRDPDRVNYPMRRREDGTFERVTWDEAIGDISSRLRIRRPSTPWPAPRSERYSRKSVPNACFRREPRTARTSLRVVKRCSARAPCIRCRTSTTQNSFCRSVQTLG